MMKSKTKLSRGSFLKSFRLTMTTVTLGAIKLFANPHGMTVVSGSASSVENGSLLTITTSQNAFLNWQSFNIGANETTTFLQPSAASIVWNRIDDPNPSQIFGRLNANGTVVLMNQSGFYFGPNCFIQAVGFIATTAVPPPDFTPGGQWQFNGMPPLASIINYGKISVGSGGSLFLIADAVENHGTLEAPDGKIGLYAGKRVLLSDRPDGRGISVSVDLPSGSVNNDGQLIADGGSILLHAQTVNQDGLIQANSVRNQNGVIELVASDELNLGANSQIVAHGDDTSRGSSGGSVALHSENIFRDNAGSRIITRGGAKGGNGGDIEVSAPAILSLASSMDAQAVAGWLGGKFLLDPANITLGSSGTGTVPDNGTVAYDAGTGTLLLNVNTAFANKNFSQITLQATANITLAAGTTWNLSDSTGVNEGQLTLQAGGNIVFGNNAQIFDANKWSVNLQAGVSFSSSTVQAGVGSIYLSGGLTQTLNGSIQTASGSVDLTAGQDILVGTGFIRTTGGGSINATALAGNINAGRKANGFLFSSGGTGYSVDPNLGGISTAAGGDVNLTAGNDIISFLPTSGAGGDAGSGAFGAQHGDVTLTAGHDVVGHYVVRNGTGTINAGNDAGDSSKALALSLVLGGWNVNAGQDIMLQEVRNPNGVFNSLGFSTSKTKHLFDYAASAYVNLNAGNSVQLLGSSLPRNSGIFEQGIPAIYPGSLNITAGPGGIQIANDIILFPSGNGQLHLTTTGGGALMGNKAGDLAQIVMSDSSASQYTTSLTFGPDDHATTPIHLNDPDPVTLDISGDMQNVLLITPKETEIKVGGDMVNSRFNIQNLHATDVSTLDVKGDIVNRTDFTTVPLATAPDFSVFDLVYPPLPGGLAGLGGQFHYDPVAHTLTFQGRMTGEQLAALLTLQVEVLDQSHHPILDQFGIPITKPAQFTDPAVLQALYDASQDIPLNPNTGYLVAGPGALNVSAHNMNLGATLGIQSVGPANNYALAPLASSGADINVNLTGDLDMFSTTISTIFGGDINIHADGDITVGSSSFTGNDQRARGIFTVAKSDVTVVADGDVNVNGSRIGTYDGGNVTVKSLNGSVDAGSGGQGFGAVSEVFVDPLTYHVTISQLLMPGSGIFAMTFPSIAGLPASQNPVGNITIEAAQNIVTHGSGILQLPLNGLPSSAAIYLTAGDTIDASGSGVISLASGGIFTHAKTIKGNIVAPLAPVHLEAQNLSQLFTLGHSVDVPPGAHIDPTVTLVGPAVNTGGSIGDPTVISLSANGGGSTIQHNDVGGNVSQSASASSDDETNKLASNDSSDDKEKKKPGNGKGPVLTHRIGRVTVLLPAI